MKNILIHLSNNENYKSFIRSLYKHQEAIKLTTHIVHNKLFDLSNAINPNMVIFPTNEYTQEIHDYITEYHKSKKIILFTTNTVVNDQIIRFWNSSNILVTGPNRFYPEQKPVNYISYDSLYDSDIYYDKKQQRSDKIAVYLSKDDTKNKELLDSILYPNTQEKILLFNSSTFKNQQNVGFLSPYDNCDVLNTFQSVIDIDNEYELECIACNIPTIVVDQNLLQNIKSKQYNKTNITLDNKSYNQFIQSIFLPGILA